MTKIISEMAMAVKDSNNCLADMDECMPIIETLNPFEQLT